MEENRNTHQLLRDAALKGDVTVLRVLVCQDPHLLLHMPAKIQPLHITSKLGRLEFTEELLRLNPNLAEELDPTDRSSPLHLASGHGHIHVVRALVSTNPCVCLARDAHGRNPAHVAAIKGHVLVLVELIRALHLCVKYNKLEALRAVVEMAPEGDARMLLNAKDRDGNTILHIAMADQLLEIVQFLLDDDRVERDVQNKYGWTAKDIFQENDKNVNAKNTGMSITVSQAKPKLLSSMEVKKKKEREERTCWFHGQRNSLMVVASLVATMAFQAGVTPPFVNDKAHTLTPYWYKLFISANTIGMVSSMSSIILLISGLPGRRFFMVVVMVLMWLAVSCMTYTYGVSLLGNTLPVALALEDESSDLLDTMEEFLNITTAGVIVWACGMALILLCHLTAWTLMLYNKFFGWLGWLSWLGSCLITLGNNIKESYTSQNRF